MRRCATINWPQESLAMKRKKPIHLSEVIKTTTLEQDNDNEIQTSCNHFSCLKVATLTLAS